MSKVTIKKPKAIVLELTGALATREFMAYSEQRRNHVKKNITIYFAECYPRNKELRLDINFFKLQESNEIKEHTFNEACPKINDGTKKLPMPDVAINHILWRLDHDFSSSALTLFLLHYNEWAYKKNLFITPVYEETKNVLEHWKSLNIAVYVDVASANFVNMILESTTQGNLIPYFSGHMNLIQFDGQKSIRNFHLLPTMLQLDAADVLFITRFPDDARSATALGINTFLLIREDFHPDFKGLIKKAEELKLTKKDTPPPKSKSVTEVNRYASGIFSLTSKLNQLSKLSGQPLSEDQKNKIMSMYDSFEEPGHFFGRRDSEIKDKSSTAETDNNEVRASPSTISVSDLLHIKYIQNLSDFIFK